MQDSKSNKYEKIVLIIGNGFDRNQNLPTSYDHFLNSIYFQKLIDEENLLALYLKEKRDLELWIDVENELANYSKISNINQEKHLKQDFKLLSDSLKEYLKNIDYTQIVSDSESYRLLKEVINKDFIILDFNYTDTIYDILSWKFGRKDLAKERIVKVHGNWKEDIIFGVEDKADIKENHIFLRKGYNKNYSTYNFTEIFEKANSIYVFGHSLGKTDEMYFKDFFKDCSYKSSSISPKEIRIYYHGEDSYDGIMCRLDDMTGQNLSVFKINQAPKFINTKV